MTLLAFSVSPVALAGPQPSPSWPVGEPLSTVLASSWISAAELQGREVFADDETPIGTLAAASDAAVISLNPRLGLGRGCVAAPFGRLWLAEERRLMLLMPRRALEAVLATQHPCSG